MLRTVELIRHPESSSNTVRTITGQACWAGETLELKFVLTGNLDRLLIPPIRSPRRADRLWEHTCFEAFLAMNDRTEYYEFNFAPSREWAGYFFHNYRNRDPGESPDLEPTITVQSAGEHLQLDVVVHPRMFLLDAELRLGLSAVIEEKNGALSYWALKHPPGKPDFHLADNFALNLSACDQQ